MTNQPASDEDLVLFRFQIFYEDTIRPLVERDIPFVRLLPPQHVGPPLDVFEIGELREATAIAALAVAGGVLPRQPFRTMLESRNIRRMLSGELGRTFSVESPSLPPPITELPDLPDVLDWSEIDLGGNLIPLMPALTTKYSSLMRQVRRNAFQRRFNAELLFSSDESWQLGMLASGPSNRFPAWEDEDNSIWLAEGLDSYLDLADDLGAVPRPDESGYVSHFDVGEAGTMQPDDVQKMIGRRSLLPLMAWRFGGATVADTVSRRVRSVEEMIVRLAAEADVETTPD